MVSGLMSARARTIGSALLGATIVASVALALVPAAPIRTYGTIRQLIEQHDVAAKVTLSDVVGVPHVYGLGSLSHLRGEITILDGG